MFKCSITRFLTSAGLLVYAGLATAQASQVAQHRLGTTAKTRVAKSKPRSAPPETTASAAPLPAPPVAVQPLRPSQMPPVAPRVSYANGELTVVAENSTLSDVLMGIRSATGAEIEMPGRAGDRVAAKIGPAPVRDVLLSLLQGSRYDYILLSSNTDPAKVERVILTAKSATGSDNAVSARNTQSGAPSADRPAMRIEEDDSEDDDQSGFAKPVQPAPVQGLPPNPNGLSNAPNPNNPNPGNPSLVNPGLGIQPGSPASAFPSAEAPGETKTPEQLLEELRRMEQQRRLDRLNPNNDRQRGERPQ